jgi:hypothetical protein
MPSMESQRCSSRASGDRRSIFFLYSLKATSRTTDLGCKDEAGALEEDMAQLTGS